MKALDIKAEAARWLRFAEEDLRGADEMLKSGDFAPRHACWLAQQAAEKALKAALIMLQVEYPKKHDLDALRNRLPAQWSVVQDCPDLAELTEWAVESRYPGDWPEASPTDARKAVAQARQVVEAVNRDIFPQRR